MIFDRGRISEIRIVGLHWLKGNYKHIIIILGLLVYLLVANTLYVRFVLKNGKPLDTAVQIPATSPKVTYKLGDFTPVRYEGEDLYQLKAYAFVTSTPSMGNKITAVLTSPERQVVFPTVYQPHPNMIQSFSGYKPTMDKAEFILLISNNALPSGTYQIGFLLEQDDGAGTSRAYAATSGKIIKTPNTIRFVAAP